LIYLADPADIGISIGSIMPDSIVLVVIILQQSITIAEQGFTVQAIHGLGMKYLIAKKIYYSNKSVRSTQLVN
jgi:hypothetical protein